MARCQIMKYNNHLKVPRSKPPLISKKPLSNNLHFYLANETTINTTPAYSYSNFKEYLRFPRVVSMPVYA